MKNLLKRYTPEELDIMPRKITGRKLAKFNSDWCHYRGGNEHKVGDYYPYKIVDRVLEKFLGKHINEAFSYYITLVPKYQQHVFWWDLDRSKRYRYSKYFTTDDNDVIIKVDTRQKREFVVYSEDYKVEIRHKITGDLKPSSANWRNSFQDRVKTFSSQIGWCYRSVTVYRMNWDQKGYRRYNATDADFVAKIVSGFKKTYTSARDPKYVRHTAEKQKKLKIERKLQKQKREEEFMARLHMIQKLEEARKRREKAENTVTILKHGFDPVTSFRTEKQTNPDFIINDQNLKHE